MAKDRTSASKDQENINWNFNKMHGEGSNSRADCPRSAETLRFTQRPGNPSIKLGGGGQLFQPSSPASQAERHRGILQKSARLIPNERSSHKESKSTIQIS